MRDRISGLNPALVWLSNLLSCFASEDIKIPIDFHEQVKEIKDILRSDVSGLVNSMLDFAIDSATVDYIIETSNIELNNIIDYWLKHINISLLGRVPTGIKSLSKEYYRERWKNSSLIVLRSTWEDVNISGTKFYLPTKMWFVDGANIKVENASKNGNRIIGTEKYSLKVTEKILKPLPIEDNERIFIQKPFSQWSQLYPVPFLVQRGILKNLKVYDLINKKGEQIVGKALEYLLLLKKGSEQMAMKGDPDYTYTTEELQAIKTNFEQMLAASKMSKGVPTYVSNFDTSLEHLIPDYSKILNAALFENPEKRLLAGLGLIDIVEGTSSSRRESLLNPKPFIAQTESGIKDFVSLLSDVIETIKIENKEKHKKYMNEEIELHYPPIKQFITDNLRDHFRSTYDRGLLSKQTYIEVIGDFDLDIEKKRRVNETEENLDTILYPPITQNQEGKGIDIEGVPPIETTPPDKVGPEKKNYKAIYEEAPYKDNKDLPDSVKVLPPEGQTLWRNVFNKSYPKGEDYARKVAWTVVKKIFKKVEDKWVKKTKTKGEDGKMISLENASTEEILTNIIQLQKIELQDSQLKLAAKLLKDEGGKNENL